MGTGIWTCMWLTSTANVLYSNDGDGTFTKLQVRRPTLRLVCGATWGDYADGDGDPDLYVDQQRSQCAVSQRCGRADAAVWGGGGCVERSEWVVGRLRRRRGSGPVCGQLFGLRSVSNVLYRNDGGDAFVDVSSGAGVAFDLAPALARRGSTTMRTACWICMWPTHWSLDMRSPANQLYRNGGDGTFVDVAQSAGVADGGNSYGAAWGDYDGDGDPDLHVANV